MVPKPGEYREIPTSAYAHLFAVIDADAAKRRVPIPSRFHTVKLLVRLRIISTQINGYTKGLVARLLLPLLRYDLTGGAC